MLIAAVVIAVLVIGAVMRAVSAALTTAIVIVAIILVLQFVFGISPSQIWQQVNQILQGILRLIPGFR